MHVKCVKMISLPWVSCLRLPGVMKGAGIWVHKLRLPCSKSSSPNQLLITPAWSRLLPAMLWLPCLLWFCLTQSAARDLGRRLHPMTPTENPSDFILLPCFWVFPVETPVV